MTRRLLEDLTAPERRLLVASARCGPIPVRVAHQYFGLSRVRLNALMQRGLLETPPDVFVDGALRGAFRTARNAGLPARCPVYTSSRKALREMLRHQWIRGWYRIQGGRATPHDLRLLACYLHAPLAIRQSWSSEAELLEEWYRTRGFVGGERSKVARPRVPDASFLEGGRRIALEIHNVHRGTPRSHPVIAAKRRALWDGTYPADYWSEYRVITLTGEIYRWWYDGDLCLDFTPESGPAPDNVWPFWVRTAKGREEHGWGKETQSFVYDAWEHGDWPDIERLW